MAHMKADHTPVEDVGRIAQEAEVKTLVLSHLIPAFDSIATTPGEPPRRNISRARSSSEMI
jgi:ribonuclease BN (tRNA processing enzyme)